MIIQLRPSIKHVLFVCRLNRELWDNRSQELNDGPVCRFENSFRVKLALFLYLLKSLFHILAEIHDLNLPHKITTESFFYPFSSSRCSQKSQKVGIRHGIFPGEDQPLPELDPNTNNAGKLYHYRVTISPPTNFLVKVKNDKNLNS